MSDHDSTFQPKAEDTLTGATSEDVNIGLGKPIQGQSSAELHHDGQSHRKRQKEGLVGLAETESSGARETAEVLRKKEEAREDAEMLGKKVPGDH